MKLNIQYVIIVILILVILYSLLKRENYTEQIPMLTALSGGFTCTTSYCPGRTKPTSVPTTTTPTEYV